jgi:subtilisin family serine protease
MSPSLLRRLVAGAVALACAAAAGLATAAPAYADDVRDRSWHLRALRIDEVHAVTRGAGITVAVIDTGVDPNHQDLVGNVLPGFDVTDPANASQGHADSDGHGTSMASLIAGHGHGPNGQDGVLGIAPEAKILPFDVTDPRTGTVVRGAISRAIRMAVDAGADVICVALAGPSEGGERSALQYAADHGVVVVAGVGNEPSVFVEHPAAVPLALATTAYDQAGEPVTTVRGTRQVPIDIAAPGADIVGAVPGNRYVVGRGTSAATAIVAGILALVLSAHPGLSRNEQVERIVYTADDIGEEGRDSVFGWGAVNAVEAVTGTPQRPDGGTSTEEAASDEEATDEETTSDEEGASAAGPDEPAGRGVGTVLVVIAVVVLLAAATVVALVVRRRTTPSAQ